MISVQLLEDDDVFLETDWCRPLTVEYGECYSDSIHFKSTYGGSPINNFEWVQAKHIFGKRWFGSKVKEIHSIINTKYEFARGIIPPSHQLNLKEYNLK